MKPSQLLFRVVPLVVAGIGAWLLLQSPDMGLRAAGGILTRYGGGMNTDQFLLLVEGSIGAYRWLGAIMVGVGAYRFLRYLEYRGHTLA